MSAVNTIVVNQSKYARPSVAEQACAVLLLITAFIVGGHFWVIVAIAIGALSVGSKYVGLRWTIEIAPGRLVLTNRLTTLSLTEPNQVECKITGMKLFGKRLVMYGEFTAKSKWKLTNNIQRSIELHDVFDVSLDGLKASIESAFPRT